MSEKMSLKDRIIRSFVDVVIVVDKLDPIADAETIKFRMSKCKDCKFNVNEECVKCDCYIDKKVESAANMTARGLVVTHCPMGYWDDKNLAIFYNN